MNLCRICGGRLQAGEPVVAYEDGLAHRFSTTCNWYKEQAAALDPLDLDSSTKPWSAAGENSPDRRESKLPISQRQVVTSVENDLSVVKPQ